MAEYGTFAAKHWAVLIGVNFYPRDEDGSISQTQCLQGAVPDVQAMQQYLEDARYPVNITVLTATTPDDATSTKPQEDPKLWPTRENVTQSLIKVRDEAKKGDFVCIHFSGHGAKLPSGRSRSENLALVLFEDQPGYRSYLKGENLRFCLRDMVRKGLLVTVVLDCCFSGSVLRSSQAVGTSIRALEYDSAVDDAFPPERWSSLFDPGHSNREAELQHEWVINPEGYTILAACGLDETAHELQSSTGERLGGLTQFLVRALTDLRRRNVKITQESLYSHICARFKAAWGAQTPRLYGNRGFSFFGGPQAFSANPLIPVFWRNTGTGGARGERRLYLRAGDAHGVSKGDTYDAYPLGLEDGMPVTIRVHAVHSLNSEMVEVESASVLNRIQDGWNAKLLSSVADHQIAMRITEEAHGHAKGSVGPDRLKFVRLHIGDKNKEACQFNVQLNHARQYCIYDGSMQLLSGVPLVSVDEPEADIRLLYILQRLASYTYLEGVGADKPKGARIQEKGHTLRGLGDSFTLEAFTDESDICLEGPFHVKDGNSWSLNVKNRSNETLYLALFNFTSSWKIFDLTRGGNNSFEEIQSGEKGRQEPIPLTMKVPEGKNSCKDVIKVLLTNRPTCFPAMNLDTDLMECPSTGRAGETVQSGIGGLPAFLKALTGSYRDSSGIEQKGIEYEAWITQNYIIYTSLDGCYGK